MLSTSGFVHDVMYVHNRSGKGDANKAYTQSDSHRDRTGGRSLMCIIVLLTIAEQHFNTAIVGKQPSWSIRKNVNT